MKMIKFKETYNTNWKKLNIFYYLINNS